MSCNTWHRVKVTTPRMGFWPCCSYIVHAWCRSNPYAQLNVSTSYQLDDPDSQGEWSLHLNCIFFPVPTKQRCLAGEIRANVALRIHQSGLHWLELWLLFPWSPVWKPSDSKDVTLCWRYRYSHQPEPNPVLDWLGVDSLGLGEPWLWFQKLVVCLGDW